MTVSHRDEGAHGFDFLRGSWRVANRRLKSRLTGPDDWEEFEASVDNSPLLGGLGNIDRFRADRGGTDFEAFALRVYDPATGRWSIYWADNVGCELGPPVVGSFVAGAGEFFGEDLQDDKSVLVRFRWSEIMSGSARWEQAFSEDRGGTWETNWTMEFTRKRRDRRG